jgi:glycosyltransferase involved in cell wall biosynthesis/peptidoglycan/xylan/chitin deacetylase (PgdA/CDA1 family)
MLKPALTVIVATYNRRERLRACLDSLARQTEPPDAFEVVVVVDGSTDGSAEMLAKLVPPFRLSIVSQPRSGQSAACNAGAARARGRVLLFIDDDEEAAPTLVGAHLRNHRDGEEVAGIGAIVPCLKPDADRFARILAARWRVHSERLSSRPLTYLDCYGGNFSVTRSAFEKVGGFATDLLRENDFELAYRLDRAGVEFRFVPDAWVTEHQTKGRQELVSDFEASGRIAIELYRRHPAMIEKMEIGGYDAPPGRWAALRHLVLALGIPPRVLAAVGMAMPRQGWARAAFQFVGDCAYWRGVRAACDRTLWRSLRRGVLILNYHAFARRGERPSRYVVPVQRFARQTALLKRCRYNVISLDDYVDYRRTYRLPPPRSVVITIDDGYVDTDTIARPILERFGFPATAFLITSADGHPGGSDPSLAGRPVLDLMRARDLVGSGMRFGAHTRTHPDLTVLDPRAVDAEVGGSKNELEHALGVPVCSFAYPFGALNESVRHAVQRAGFWSACGVVPGRNRPATDSFKLHRTEVRGTYTLLGFAMILLFGDARRLGLGRKARRM